MASLNSLLTILLNQVTGGYMLAAVDREEDNFLAAMLLIGALVFAIVAVIGIVLALLFVLMVILLISGGIISASVLVGLQQKSVSKGFKAFFLSVSIVGSTIVSVVFFLFINTVAEWKHVNGAIIAGVIFGIGAGWILGVVMFTAANKIVLFLKGKYDHKMMN